MPALHVAVREHDTLVRSDQPISAPPNVTALPGDAFDAVRETLLGPALAGVATPARFGPCDALKLTQWVGVIRAPDGTTVEILPKPHERSGHRARPDSLQRSRNLLMRMLAVTDARFREAPPADLQAGQTPLSELIIRYALEGIRAAVRRGLPHAYIPVQEERAGLRGRLDLPRQMRQPPHRAHLLHVTYDEFLPDRPETRLTRLALQRLLTLTRVPAHQRLARELLLAFGDVPPSRNVTLDFGAWRLGRSHSHFAPLEGICRMVINELNPMVGGADHRASALLFNMNVVFEGYVAHLLAERYPDWQVDTQVTDYPLGDAFDLKIDLLLRPPGATVIVADTKWKRLASSPPTYGVSNDDAYQMLAYSHAVEQLSSAPAALWLIYPRLPGFPASVPAVRLSGERHLQIITVDLEQEEPEQQWPTQAVQLTLPTYRQAAP